MWRHIFTLSCGVIFFYHGLVQYCVVISVVQVNRYVVLELSIVTLFIHVGMYHMKGVYQCLSSNQDAELSSQLSNLSRTQKQLHGAPGGSKLR